jgi:nitroimidazol reductase NimA-like FMN-containing flavoprotein (pyridoxamine 5'-phosphate oxidase superfamily)
MQDVLAQLKNRPTFEEQWPMEYQSALAKGRARVLQLEQIRTQSVTMTDILSARPDILKWWMEIDS